MRAAAMRVRARLPSRRRKIAADLRANLRAICQAQVGRADLRKRRKKAMLGQMLRPVENETLS